MSMTFSLSKRWAFTTKLALLVAAMILALPGCTNGVPKTEGMSQEAFFEEEFTQGLNFYNAGEYQKAVEKFQLALQKAYSLENDEKIGRTLSNLGFSYRGLKDFPQALKFSNEGALYYEKTKNFKVLAVLLGNIGYIHTQMGAYQMATEVLDRSLDVSQKAMGVANSEAQLEILRTRLALYFFKAVSHGQLGEFSRQVDSYQQMVADFSKVRKLGNREGQFELTQKTGRQSFVEEITGPTCSKTCLAY